MHNRHNSPFSLPTLLSVGIALSLTSLPVLAKKHALVIGISDYKHVSRLASAVKDAEKMEAFFTEDVGIEKANIESLYNQQATHDNILAAFDRLRKKVQKGDQVFVYYSGHGSQIRDTNHDEKDQWDETLVSIDAYDKDGTGVFVNMVLDDELDQAFQQIESKGVKTVMISDSCHSGSITRSIAGTKNIGLPPTFTFTDPRKIIDSELYQQRRHERPFLAASPQRVEWSAASAGQVAYENTSMGGGVFTRYFLDGLKEKKADQNNDGVVSNSELLRYVQQQSKVFCDHSPICTEEGYHLTPTLSIADNRYGEAALLIQQAETEGDLTIASNTNTSTSTISRPPSFSQREKMLHMLEQTLPLNTPEQLRISIVNGNKLKVGQDIFVKINSDKNGYLILLDVDAKGRLVQVFPNKYYQDNAIKAKKALYVPKDALQAYAMTATDAGKSHLYAIVTHDKIDLSAVLTQHQDLAAVVKPSDYASAIAQRLGVVWQGEATNRLSDYSVARFDYQVSEK